MDKQTPLAKIMIVDDEQHVLDYIAEIVKSINCDVIAKAHNGIEALELLETVNPDLILLDVTMPGLQGDELLEKIREKDSDVKIVMVTTRNSMEVVRSCSEKGANGYILKNQGPEYIGEKIKEAVLKTANE